MVELSQFCLAKIHNFVSEGVVTEQLWFYWSIRRFEKDLCQLFKVCSYKTRQYIFFKKKKTASQDVQQSFLLLSNGRILLFII